MIILRQKEMKLLIYEELESCLYWEVCYLCNKKFYPNSKY